MSALTVSFVLHPQLAADSIIVGDLALSRVLLMNDARFPWLLLVPRRSAIREIIDLAGHDQATLFREIADTSRAMTALFAPDKLNVAAIGNMVAQLHVHVVARRETDEAWPRPVWGSGTSRPHDPAEVPALVGRIAAALGGISPPAGPGAVA